MNTEVTGSIQQQCSDRLSNLYTQSHKTLLSYANWISKNREEAEELCSDLYLYLAKQCREKIWWGDSYNILYCQKFLRHRWLNRAPKLDRTIYVGPTLTIDIEEIEYNYERDERIMRVHEEVMAEIQRIKKTKMFAPAMIWELYWTSDDTLDEVAHKIGISKSTVFLAIKKIRKYMKENIKTPFED